MQMELFEMKEEIRKKNDGSEEEGMPRVFKKDKDDQNIGFDVGEIRLE